jgi:hypothetical protein
MHSDDIVRLTTANNPAEAHLWCEALQEEGIRCRVVGDYLEAGLGDIPGIRAEVWVHRDDVERAQAILAAHQGKEHPEEPE